jgi:hypothetical protein
MPLPQPEARDSTPPGRRGRDPCFRRPEGRATSGALRSAKILPMLRLVLPKGSLEKATFQLFSDADLAISRSSGVTYRAHIADPRIDEVRILRPQEIPVYVAQGLFDIGITGRDWSGGVRSPRSASCSTPRRRPTRCRLSWPWPRTRR